jgi:hypothetical protein
MYANQLLQLANSTTGSLHRPRQRIERKQIRAPHIPLQRRNRLMPTPPHDRGIGHAGRAGRGDHTGAQRVPACSSPDRGRCVRPPPSGSRRTCPPVIPCPGSAASSRRCKYANPVSSAMPTSPLFGSLRHLGHSRKFTANVCRNPVLVSDAGSGES